MPWGKEQWYPYRRLESPECETRINKVSRVVQKVSPQPEFNAIVSWIIFGSLARKDTRFNSDVDIIAITRGLADLDGQERRRDLYSSSLRVLTDAARKFRYEELQFHVTVVDEVWLADPQSNSSMVPPAFIEVIKREGIKILT